jgi:phage N-6-adenine-methyltransferase
VNKELMFSSASDMWETPQELFDQLNFIYGGFETDVCATADNAKCEKYYTPETNGLAQEWRGMCWCNPPYGRTIGKWIEKAVKSDADVVMLLPARTDTKWFHDFVLPYGKIQFLKGRLKFGGCKNSAPFPSMIVVFPKRTSKEYEENICCNSDHTNKN